MSVPQYKEYGFVFVGPDGTAAVGSELGDDFEPKRLRFALGNPAHPGSLYGEDPRLVPWSTAALKASLAEAEAVRDESARRMLARNIGLMTDSEPCVAYPMAFANREIHNPRYRYKVLYGGRGSAKTRAAADYLLMKAAAAPTKYACFRYTFASIRDSVKEQFSESLAALGLEKRFEVQESAVKARDGGSYFPFRGMKGNLQDIKSMPDFDGAWVEEAQSITREALDVLDPTIRKPGSELIFTLNPRLKRDAVYAAFLDGDPPEHALLLPSSWKDNPWFQHDQYLIAMRDKERDRALYDHKWGGGLQMRPDAQVVKHWKTVGGKELEALEREVAENPRAAPIYGLDVAETAPTAFVEAFVLPPKDLNSAPRLFISRERYQSRLSLTDVPAFLYGSDPRRRWTNRHGYSGFPDATFYPVMVDPSPPGTATRLKELGINAVKASKPAGSVEQGIQDLNSFDKLVSERCPNVIREFQSYSFKIDAHTGDPTEAIDKKDDHSVDALRYALQGYRRNVFPSAKRVEWRSNEPRPPASGPIPEDFLCGLL